MMKGRESTLAGENTSKALWGEKETGTGIKEVPRPRAGRTLGERGGAGWGRVLRSGEHQAWAPTPGRHPGDCRQLPPTLLLAWTPRPRWMLILGSSQIPSFSRLTANESLTLADCAS